MCFELPEFVAWNPCFPTTIVPLQLFRSVIDSVLDQLDPETGPCSMIRQQRHVVLLRDAEEVSRDGEWLPLIEKWLPGSWTDVQISDRAVKADNAVVDFRPWHMRISLVLPCSATALEILTRFFMRRWRFNVVRSFLQYLTTRYGPEWQTLVFAHPVRAGAQGEIGEQNALQAPCRDLSRGSVLPSWGGLVGGRRCGKVIMLRFKILSLI
jgi:hypothetical protein